MKAITQNIFLAVAALLALAAVYLFVIQPVQNAHASVSDSTFIGAATTSSAVSVTVSARLLASTTNSLGTGYTRAYAVICNANANPVWLNLDNDKAANSSSGAVTTVIAAAAGYSVCYEVTGRNLYQGSITASSTNQTATTVTVKDYVQ